MTTAVLIGATGRMGTAIVRESVRAGAAGKTLEIVAAVASPAASPLGSTSVKSPA